MPDLIDAMRAVCATYGTDFVATPGDAVLGVADNVVSGTWPLNGFRHSQDQTSGWFLFGGTEASTADDFYKPMHAAHLIERCPEVMPYLALPPGWRFLIAPDHEDVWEQPSLRDDSV